jgi:hypothetical protein
MVFGGGSKTYKTWAMSDLAISIASGVAWWIFKCFLSSVLYVNFELKPYYARERFKAIRKAKGIQKSPANLWIWNLRDHNVSSNLNSFRDQTIEFILEHSIAVIFLDPFYKLVGQRDERVSAELAPVLNMFEDISRSSDTSTVTAAHYTKGNQACNDPVDRISGGGIINRHPDNLLMLTKHETEGSFTIDIITRDFPPISPFVVTWTYPLLLSDSALDPAKIKTPRPGRRKEYDCCELFNILKDHDDELSTAEWQKLVAQETGMSRSLFYNLLKELIAQKKIFLSTISKKWNLKST